MEYFNSNQTLPRIVLCKPTKEQIETNIEYKALDEALDVLKFNMSYFFSFYGNTIHKYLEKYICDDLIGIVIEYIKPEGI